MEDLLFYLLTFVAVYLIYLFFVILKGKSRERYKNSTEIRFLERRYKIDVDKIGFNKLAHISALCNAFIIANTVLIISLINNLVLKMIAGFIILIPMILCIYHLIGKYYQNKQRKK
jgi:hypothetical protein